MSYSAQAASSSHSSPSSSSSINHNSPNHTHSSTSKSKSRKSIQPVETEEEKLRRLERLEIEHRSKIRSQEARDRFVTYIRAKVAPRNVAGIADAIDEAMARFERQLQTLEAQSTKQSIAMKQYEELAQRLNAENQALLQTVCSLRAECQNQQPSTPAGPYYSSMISATYQMPHSYPAIHRPTPVYGFSTSSFGSI
ncbi:hypothetical protein SISNIDRAFT_470753 [Sistotremastrum niveocremeum HHB9708]|uniref:Uncharacterized protein n=2 Tax=Sistotremastraceae TaxID=3402574 RepID=A0A164NI46_9AGAM|nr:hypothetical protein SISNIDRAFT_470753 [Sistotremastrum niveocremeum HHB9708]KZT35358.1 hypothetical protein SISSUDRAFT_1035627 [Sistotremastrum suecicum HHB10207 ss-3]